jgi:hypothetical protein
VQGKLLRCEDQLSEVPGLETWSFCINGPGYRYRAKYGTLLWVSHVEDLRKPSKVLDGLVK